MDKRMSELVAGQKFKAGIYHGEILAIEMHFGNWQVKFFDRFYSRTRWMEITQFQSFLSDGDISR